MKIQRLVVHHSASNSDTTSKMDIERWHKQRGFSQIGYHKVIEKSGKIVEGRSESLQGAHARGANHASLGVCVIGDFDKNSLSVTQLDALVFVLATWCKSHNLDATSIYGHFNVPGGSTKTDCPGSNLKNQLSVVKQKITAILGKK